MAGRTTLGAFELHERIGSGGMARVFRGRHASTATPVAIKLLRPRPGDAGGSLASLRAEVQAAASLDHPAIARVLDFGVATGGAPDVPAGSPWMALELASGGALSFVLRPLPWSASRHLLLVLLDALAHAHARGVVHRDLKPANVLLCAPEDARPGVKLTDFGMAGRIDDDGAVLAGVTGGTPRYMAPEQFTGDNRSVGPWTDLYALGCLAYDLATGQPPFAGRGWKALMAQHMGAAPSGFKPAHAYPEGFVSWVLRLLEKHPLDRFRCAADARHALLALDPAAEPAMGALPPDLALPGLGGGARGALPVDDRRVSATAETLVNDGHDTAHEDGGSAVFPQTESDSAVATVSYRFEGSPLDATPSRVAYEELPPFPEHPDPAYETESGEAAMRLVGAGLSLFGVRRPRFVGREHERELLWRKLRAVHATAGVHAVALVGAAGSGKSRLAGWLCERAHELGVATPLRARHTAAAGGADGLAPMLARHLRVVGVGAGAARRRVWSWHLARGLTTKADPEVALALARPDARDDGHVVLRGAGERHPALLRFLSHVAAERPLVVWLDDVQWGSDALRFARHALAARHAPPLLLVLTAREEALARDAALAAELDELCAQPRAARVDVPPLPPADHRELVHALLPLEVSLVERVRARTEGNPLFAVQLVGEWVQRDRLLPSPDGFVLRAGAEDELPDNLSQVWGEALANVVGSSPAGARDALEIAATLGEHVVETEWRAAVAKAASPLSSRELADLVGRLVGAGLAVRTDEGWSFAHGMLRETLEGAARAEGRFASHSAAVADALEALWGNDAAGVAARLGRHRAEAGEWERALPALLHGARELLHQHDLGDMEHVLEAWERSADALRLPDDDVRRGEAELLRVQAMTARSAALRDARTAARALLRRAVRDGWGALVPPALRLEALVAYRQGALDEATELYGRAAEAARAVGDDDEHLLSLLGIADVDYYQARREAAATAYRAALDIADARGDRAHAATCLWGLGCIDMWRGELARAETLLRRQVDLAEREGDRLAHSRGLNTLGECLRLLGRHDEASEVLVQASSLLAAVGSRAAMVVDMNLATVDLDRGDAPAARRALERLLPLFQELEEGPPACICDALLMACAALAGDWPRFDQRLERVLEAVQASGLIEGDLAEALERAGRAALAADHPERARRALSASRAQWTGVGWRARAEEVDALLAAR